MSSTSALLVTLACLCFAAFFAVEALAASDRLQCDKVEARDTCEAKAGCGWCYNRCYNPVIQTCCGNFTVCSDKNETCCAAQLSFSPSICCRKGPALKELELMRPALRKMANSGAQTCCSASTAECCNSNATCCIHGGAPPGFANCCAPPYKCLNWCCKEFEQCGEVQCCAGSCYQGQCALPPAAAPSLDAKTRH